MALKEDIKERKERANTLEAIVEGLVSSQTDPKAPNTAGFRQALGQYIHSRDPTAPEDFFMTMPYADTLEEAKYWAGETQNELVEFVEKNLDPAIDLLEKNGATTVALSIRPYDNTGKQAHDNLAKEQKMIMDLQQGLKNQDVGAYIALFKDQRLQARMALLSQKGETAQIVYNAFGRYYTQKMQDFVKHMGDKDDIAKYVKGNVDAGSKKDRTAAAYHVGQQAA